MARQTDENRAEHRPRVRGMHRTSWACGCDHLRRWHSAPGDCRGDWIATGQTGGDLRMLGFVRRVSLASVMDLRPWAALGLAINLVTGLMFFVGAPDQYIHNPAWWTKVAFILIAGLNILAFELSPHAKALVQAVGAGDNTPLRLKFAGGISLFSWFAVLYFGRMLPFIGNAF